MSELLGNDLDDFDETEEQNEEDLLELGDAFADVEIVTEIKSKLAEFSKEQNGHDYLMYCCKQLKPEDYQLAITHLKINEKPE
jgi:hypothetical protein